MTGNAASPFKKKSGGLSGVLVSLRRVLSRGRFVLSLAFRLRFVGLAFGSLTFPHVLLVESTLPFLFLLLQTRQALCAAFRSGMVICPRGPPSACPVIPGGSSRRKSVPSEVESRREVPVRASVPDRCLPLRERALVVAALASAAAAVAVARLVVRFVDLQLPAVDVLGRSARSLQPSRRLRSPFPRSRSPSRGPV